MSGIGDLRFLCNKQKRILLLSHFAFSKKIDDKKYLEQMYYAKTGEVLNLNNPVSFGEKLQWLKLYNRKPIYTTMVDKILAKEYVAGIFGNEIIIPTIAVWDDPHQIDFDKLPNRFVLKCNHNSGLGMFICKDKNSINAEKVIKDLQRGITEDFYSHGREWPYKDVNRKVFAEQYMESSPEEELRDYKFYCFNGEPKFCQVICNRTKNETIDFFDMDWNLQEFTGLDLPYKPHAPYIEKPKCFNEMAEKARILANNIPFVRIDFYEINNRVYFGEITFFPASGFGRFYPDIWNNRLGNMVKLEGINNG